MERFGMKEGEELQHPWLNRSVETAQKRVEQQHYVWRKRILEYDDVMNKQREVVYEYRNDVIDSTDTRILIDEALDKGVREKVAEFVPEDGKAQREPTAGTSIINWVNLTFPVGISEEEAAFDSKNYEQIVTFLIERIRHAYHLKTRDGNPQAVQDLERMILLNAIDRLWQEHLYALDALKEGVGLRTHGQKDPLVEFKIEAYQIFSELMLNINNEVLNNLFRGMAQLQAFEQFLAQMSQQRRATSDSVTTNSSEDDEAAEETTTASNEPPKPRIMLPSMMKKPAAPAAGRNDPCPCGSGKKFKQCCGKLG
jgi:preprotein translocase subunit SecA